MTHGHPDVLLIQAATEIGIALLIVVAVLCIKWKDSR